MLRVIAAVVFAAAVISTAQAMPFASSYRPDNMITQTRMGCGMGRVMVNGVCVSRAGIRQARRCARWNGGVCAVWY
jgi:hypothetical protein